jgi:hypothetical protein
LCDYGQCQEARYGLCVLNIIHKARNFVLKSWIRRFPIYEKMLCCYSWRLSKCSCQLRLVQRRCNAIPAAGAGGGGGGAGGDCTGKLAAGKEIMDGADGFPATRLRKVCDRRFDAGLVLGRSRICRNWPGAARRLWGGRQLKRTFQGDCSLAATDP